MTSRGCVLLPLAAAFAAPLGAQVTVYRSQPDAIWWRAQTVGARYYVRGGDTSRMTWNDVSVARSRWSGGDPMRLLIEVHELGPVPAIREDTLAVLASGRVVELNGRAPGQAQSYLYDVLPRLPEPPRRLRPGTSWADSLIVVHHPPASLSREVRESRLHARVTRELDTLGTRAIEVLQAGTLRLQVAEVDSASRDTLYFVGDGPLEGRWYFDVRRGTFLGNVASFDIRGASWTTRPGLTDTVPTGQSKRWSNHQIPAERAARMIRPLPRGDTLIATDEYEAPRSLHIVARAPDSLALGVIRDDGSVGTATAWYGAAGDLRRLEVLWTDSTGAMRRFGLIRHGDSLTLGGTKTRVAVPEGLWAVSDEGLSHLLVPLLRRLHPEQAYEVQVFWLSAGHWGRVSVRGRPLAGGTLWALQSEGSDVLDVLLIDDAGDMLTVVRTNREAVLISQAAPPAASPRYARYERLTAVLQQQPQR